MTDVDLPRGYRWATSDEAEMPPVDHMVVTRTFDSQGREYTQGEAGIAVPCEEHAWKEERTRPGGSVSFLRCSSCDLTWVD